MQDDADAQVPVPRGWPPGFGLGVDRPGLVVLTALRGIRPRQLHELAWREGSAARCVAAIRDGRAGSDGDRDHLGLVDPVATQRDVEALGARMVAPGEGDYVERFLDLPDPPAALFVRGHPLPEQPPMVAIVGARRCSNLGHEITRDLARSLAGVGYCVVSGAARGIDEAAHLGALTVDGRTVAVLGAGIDHPYPRTGRRFLDRVLEARGTLLAEYPPGVEPTARHFPARNRLIAALALAVVVVEGGERSGSRITADHALDLGRDVYAVPGPITSPLSITPNGLIRDGATLITSVDDVLEGLGVPARLAHEPPPTLEGDELRVWEAIVEPTLPDGIARRAGLSIPATFEIVTRLELRDLVRSVGGRYERRHVPVATDDEVPDEVPDRVAEGPLAG